MKKLVIAFLLLLFLTSALFASYEVRNYCEDCAAFKYTIQSVLDSSWKAAGCEAHTVRDFTCLRQIADVTVADEGYAIMPTMFMPSPGSSAAIQPSGSVNDVNVVQVVLPFQLVVSDIQFYIDTKGGGGAEFGCGIYDIAGTTLLLETGGVDATSTGLKKATLATAVTLDAGTYWFAYTSDNTSVRIQGIDALSAVNDLFDDTVDQAGTAANTSTDADLPATLGAITYAALPVPFALMKP